MVKKLIIIFVTVQLICLTAIIVIDIKHNNKLKQKEVNNVINRFEFTRIKDRKICN